MERVLRGPREGRAKAVRLCGRTDALLLQTSERRTGKKCESNARPMEFVVQMEMTARARPGERRDVSMCEIRVLGC